MDNLQLFNFEGNKLRSLMIDEVPYFVAKDATRVLGYQDYGNAIKKHVDEEDKISKIVNKSQILQNAENVNDSQRMINVDLINESGLYSLILSSKMPNAKKFKHWVTSEVLPAIRKTGSYQIPQTPEEQLALTMKSTVHLAQRMDKAEKDIDEIKNKSEIDSAQRYKLEMARKKHVIEIVGGKSSNFYKQKKTRKVFSALFHDLANEFMVSRYADITKEQFDDAMKFIQDWYPSYPLKQEIDTVNVQTAPQNGGNQND